MNTVETPPAVPLLVLGDKRRSELLARIGACVERWMKSYNGLNDRSSFAAGLHTIEEAARSANIFDVDNVVVCGALDGGEQFAIVASADIFAAVLGAPASWSAMNSGGDIADAIRDEALKELGQSLVAGVRQGPWHITVAESRLMREKISSAYKRGWSAAVRFGSRRERLDIFVTATLVSSLTVVGPVQGAAALSRRRAAIVDESIRVEAVLGEASVSIGDLASLAVDDVIVMQQDTSQPGYLLTSTGRRVANVSIGRIGSKRAAMIAK